MQIESVELVKSVILTCKQQFLQMISSAAEGLFFSSSTLLIHAKDTLIER